MNFSYLLFFHHPITSMAFLALMMTCISLWIHKRLWIFASFLAVALIFAAISKLIDLKVLIVLVILGVTHFCLSTSIKNWARLIPIVIAMILSFALLFHLVPGFDNWNLTGKIRISPHAFFYTLYLNFDKPFIGLLPLAFSIPLIQSRFHIRQIAIPTCVLTALGMVILLLSTLYLHVANIDFKVPAISLIWLINNFFLVVIPEEAFFRGFLQRELREYIQTKWAPFFAIFAVSLLFAVSHFAFIQDIRFIVLIFIGGLIYGTVYEVTQAIESAILCHFLVNVSHFFCFTYPALIP